MSGSATTAGQTERSAPAGTPPAASLIPDERKNLLEQRPLIKGEEAGDYDRLLAGLVAEIDPKGMTEWLWVKDLADNIWESPPASQDQGIVDRHRHSALGTQAACSVDAPRRGR